MPRTVVYPPKPDAPARSAAQPADRFADKLLKYVPAETIAFYVPAYALVQQSPVWLKWLVLVVAVAGTVGYLYVRSDKSSPPHWYFYLLASVAFFGWALGTSSLGVDLLGIPEAASTLAVLVVVFFVPMVDQVITRIGASAPA